MPDLTGHGDALRLGAFLGVFFLMSCWEWLAPFRVRAIPLWMRWGNNLALLFVGNAILRFGAPVTAVAFAGVIQSAGWGLLNLLAMPAALSFVIAVVLLDMGIYFQHRLFHAVPLLWRTHRVHHADTEIDVSTALRFHPFETTLSLFFKLGMIGILGPSPAAVLAFEIVLNGSAMFNHANIRLPAPRELLVRKIFVTPDMHRIHHSTRREEMNSNYGFSLSLWDRVFGTYTAEARLPQDAMPIGLDTFRTPRDVWIDRLLLQPFDTQFRGLR